MYGSRFLDQFGTEPNELWIKAIDSLSDEQCKQGLLRLVREAGEHPPTLPKFVELARRPASMPSTYSELPKLDVWQQLANEVFKARLVAAVRAGRALVPVERNAELLSGLRTIKAQWAESYGQDVPDQARAAFQTEVGDLIAALQDADA